MDIQPFDLHRMFIGELPLAFTLEIAFRTVFMYLYALFIIRVFSKRQLSQLSIFEYLIIIALGSAVGDPMFYPEVPLLHGMVVLAVVIIVNQIIIRLAIHNERIEALTESSAQRLVVDGMLDKGGMEKALLARDEVFMELRREHITQLGQVRRVYIEPDGNLSVFLFKTSETRPGLPVEPPWNLEHPKVYEAGERVPEESTYACVECGKTANYRAGDVFATCPRCQHHQWTRAYDNPFHYDGE